MRSSASRPATSGSRARLEGQPHQGRRRARCAACRRVHGCHRRLRRRVRRRLVRRTPRPRRPRRWRWPTHTVVVFLGLPPSYESEGDHATHLDGPPTRWRCSRRSVPSTTGAVVVLANGSVATHDAGAILKGWLGGQLAAGPSPTCSSVWPTRRVGSPRPCRSGWPTTPAYLKFPGEHGRGPPRRLPPLRRGRSSRSATCSATGSRTPRSTTPTSGKAMSTAVAATTRGLARAPWLSGHRHQHRPGGRTGCVGLRRRAPSVPRPVRELKAFTKVAGGRRVDLRSP